MAQEGVPPEGNRDQLAPFCVCWGWGWVWGWLCQLSTRMYALQGKEERLLFRIGLPTGTHTMEVPVFTVHNPSKQTKLVCKLGVQLHCFGLYYKPHQDK